MRGEARLEVEPEIASLSVMAEARDRTGTGYAKRLMLTGQLAEAEADQAAMLAACVCWDPTIPPPSPSAASRR